MNGLIMFGKKIRGIMLISCKMVHKDLFIVVFCHQIPWHARASPSKRILECWAVLFRSFPWSPRGDMEKFVARSIPNWLKIKMCVSKILVLFASDFETIGKILQIEESRVILPHLNAIVLIVPNPEIDITGKVALEFDEEVFYWDI